MITRPHDAWQKGDPISSQKLNQSVQGLRSLNPSVTGANVRQLPNGLIISLPDIPPIREGFVGRIHDTGPTGEADLPAETYWVWVEYFIADLWGKTVDIGDDYPSRSTDDLTNTILPVTNLCERQPGGPPDNGTHNLPLGMPILFHPVLGRSVSATDTKAVTRYVTFLSPGPGVGQYKYMYYGMVTQNKVGWDYIRANPMPGT